MTFHFLLKFLRVFVLGRFPLTHNGFTCPLLPALSHYRAQTYDVWDWKCCHGLRPFLYPVCNLPTTLTFTLEPSPGRSRLQKLWAWALQTRAPPVSYRDSGHNLLSETSSWWSYKRNHRYHRPGNSFQIKIRCQAGMTFSKLGGWKTELFKKNQLKNL